MGFGAGLGVAVGHRASPAGVWHQSGEQVRCRCRPAGGAPAGVACAAAGVAVPAARLGRALAAIWRRSSANGIDRAASGGFRRPARSPRSGSTRRAAGLQGWAPKLTGLCRVAVTGQALGGSARCRPGGRNDDRRHGLGACRIERRRRSAGVPERGAACVRASGVEGVAGWLPPTTGVAV